jgi:FixJ family two-component response regulator
MPGAVCIIDNDEGMREVLAHIVRSIGLPCELHDSAESFLLRSESSGITCMLLDVELRGMSGIALLEHVAEGGLDFPIFLISGAHDSATTAYAKRLGAGIIDKPFNARRLAQAIRAAVSSTG